MEYFLFVHKDENSPASEHQWASFFTDARNSGVFLGGSEIANRIKIGAKYVSDITAGIGGFMSFESDDISIIKRLSEKHPFLTQGGTLEPCELPKS